MNLTVLRAELDAGHPDSGPYDSDATIAASQINAPVRDTRKVTLTGDELFGATDLAEFSALPDPKRLEWLTICNRPDIRAFRVVTLNFIEDVFGAQSETVRNFRKTRQVEVSQSRASELGLGVVDAGDIKHARATA